MLTQGNHKIDKSVWCFSLPPVKTCLNWKMCRNTCYAMKSYRLYPSYRNAWDHNLTLTKSDDFAINMAMEIIDKRAEVVRIHVGGDFYSDKYVEDWEFVAAMTPETTFYGYSKAFNHLPELKVLNKLPNVNIINSILPDGEPNFAASDIIAGLMDKYDFPVCRLGKSQLCGRDCVLCHTEPRMLFIRH